MVHLPSPTTHSLPSRPPPHTNHPPVHNQIGFMAETLLSPSTLNLLTSLLEPEYNASIGRAAAWADAYAHTPAGRFSYQWHWIDTHDWAPDHCGLDYSKDCAKGGCVVSAIANQTGILRECVERVKGGMVEGGVNVTCSEALKWIAHFVGDVHQPLHASARAVGGNFYKVKFGGRETQLHAVSTISRNLGCMILTFRKNRSGMDTSLITPPPSHPPSPTPPSHHTSPTSSHASATINFTNRCTCGNNASTHLHRRNAPRSGRRRVMRCHAVMSISMRKMGRI
jgi:hypothetical protein